MAATRSIWPSGCKRRLPDDRSGHRHEPAAVQSLRLGRQPHLRSRQGDDAAAETWRPARTSAATSMWTATAFLSARCPARIRPRAALLHPRHQPRDPRWPRYTEDGPGLHVRQHGARCCANSDGRRSGAQPDRDIRASARTTPLGVIYFGSTSPAMQRGDGACSNAPAGTCRCNACCGPFPFGNDRS